MERLAVVVNVVHHGVSRPSGVVIRRLSFGAAYSLPSPTAHRLNGSLVTTNLPFRRTSIIRIDDGIGGAYHREIGDCSYYVVRRRQLSTKITGGASSPGDNSVSDNDTKIANIYDPTMTSRTEREEGVKQANHHNCDGTINQNVVPYSIKQDEWEQEDNYEQRSQQDAKEETNKYDKDEDDEDDEYDDRTFREKIRDAIGIRVPPNPDKHPEVLSKRPPKTPLHLIRCIRPAWLKYRSTWEGFLDNHGGSNQNDDDDVREGHTSMELDTKAIKKEGQKLKDNAERNVKYLRREGLHLLDFAKEKTGIRNKVDMKKWVAEQIKLASLCVNEFMKGYRKARDDEVDKMLNEYFKEFDEQEDEEKVIEKKKDEEQSIDGKENGEKKKGSIKRARMKTNRKKRNK